MRSLLRKNDFEPLFFATIFTLGQPLRPFYNPLLLRVLFFKGQE